MIVAQSISEEFAGKSEYIRKKIRLKIVWGVGYKWIG